MLRCLASATVRGVLTFSLFAFGVSLGAQNAEQTIGDSECGLRPELERALNQVFSAADTVAYTGTLLIEFNNDREFIGVNSADGTGRGSFLRLSREANGSPLVIDRSYGADRMVCSLTPFYGFNIEAGQVVAGREAYRLTVRPKDTLRLGYVMDVDSEHHLPLRVVTATPDGQVLERFEFADIQFLPTPEAAPAQTSAGQSSFSFAALPPGFAVIQEGTLNSAATPVEFMVVSDGLASVSVFVESRPRSLADGEGVVLRGATIAYSRGAGGNRLITVLGEVPITTARLLADAVRQRPLE